MNRNPLIFAALIVLGILVSVLIPSDFSIPSDLAQSFGVIFLALIAFESVARVKIHLLDTHMFNALKWVLLFNAFMLAAVTYVATLFGFPFSWAILIASLFIATNGSYLFHRTESLWSAPLGILLPFIIIGMFATPAETFNGQMLALAIKFLTGIGTGIVAGLLSHRALAHIHGRFHEHTLVAIVVLTFILSQMLGGAGLLAVIALAFFLGNVRKSLTMEGPLLDAFGCVGAFLLGTIAQIPSTFDFFKISLMLLGVYLLARFIFVYAGVKKERLAITLVSKNIPTLGVLLGIAPFVLPEIVSYGITFFIGSVLLAEAGKRLFANAF